MNKLLTIFLFLTSFTSVAQQKKCSDINCDEGLYVMYRDTVLDKDFSDKYYVGFEGGFNDTLEVYLNGFLISKGFYKTDPSLGSAGAIISFTIKKNVNLNILLIKNTSRNHCMEFSIDARFRIMYIDFEEDKWGLTYSNQFTIYE